MSRNKISLKRMISAALAAGLALTMTVTAFADEPYTAYNYDYWDAVSYTHLTLPTIA